MNHNKNNKTARRSKRKPISEINPSLLVKKATNIERAPYVSSRNFHQIELHSKLKENILRKGYHRPTEIQDRCIDQLILGKNLIGIASTGTGKTGAFLIPIIQQMIENNNLISLVVVPTRELAEQVLEEFKSLTKGTRLQYACFIGGTNVNKDIIKANKRTNLIVGTPGRLNDLIARKALRIDKTEILVLDEFDRMLDMGFINDIKKIVTKMQKRKQTMLFSATVDPSQKKTISQIIQNSISVNVSSGTKSSNNVDQDIIRIGENENKFDVLLNLVKDTSFDKVILFAETKRAVDKLCKRLVKSGINSDMIHGNKSQNYRSKAIHSFKVGKIKILVATDVAARGIDVSNVSHVINYQIPSTLDSYIHRIGRTGRAGKIGQAYTFID